jgi:hypothetical protein
MPVKRTSAGSKGAAKKKRGSSSSAPDIDHEMDKINLSNTPQEQWPENNLPYRGIKWAARASECSKNFDLFKKQKFVPSRYLDDITMRTLGIYDEVNFYSPGLGYGMFCTRKNFVTKPSHLNFYPPLSGMKQRMK